MTYIATNEGWLYLAVVIDFFNRCVVGWAMDEHPTAQLAVAALKMAYLRRRKPEHLIHHSDRGSQYASHHFRKSLKEMHFRQIMSRKGYCYDNAMVESFFHSLKMERVHRRHYDTRAEAKEDIRDYIENW